MAEGVKSHKTLKKNQTLFVLLNLENISAAKSVNVD